MPFLTQAKTNWKFIAVVAVLAIIVGAGILGYLQLTEEEFETLPVDTPEKITEDETAEWQVYNNEEYGFEIRYPQDGNLHEEAKKINFPFSSIYFEIDDVTMTVQNFLKIEEGARCEIWQEEKEKIQIGETELWKTAFTDQAAGTTYNIINYQLPNKEFCFSFVFSFPAHGLGIYYVEIPESYDEKYSQWLEKERKQFEEVAEKILSTFQFLEEVEKPEIWRLEDPISNVEIIARENRLDKDKTDIYINNLKISKESFYITLSNVPRVPGQVRVQFRNGHLYIGRNFKREIGFETEIWKYLSPEDDGTLLFSGLYFLTFNVLPNESFMVVHHEAKMEPLLTFINLNTGEQKNFDFYDLAAPEAISHFEEQSQLVMEGLRLGIYGRFRTAKWSPNFRDFWGFVYLHSTADPPVPEFASVFKINVSNWEVEKFALSRRATLFNYISPEALNIEREMVIFEQNTDGGLALYLYNLRTKEEKIIVSYPKEILDEYGAFYIYVHSVFFGVEEQDKRCLSPKWIDDNTISYFDFETREKITKKIE